jgi:hypothetical protein
MDCDHSGTYSGACRYSRQTHQLRLVLVCDGCGAERSELGNVDYSPHPVPENPVCADVEMVEREVLAGQGTD